MTGQTVGHVRTTASHRLHYTLSVVWQKLTKWRRQSWFVGRIDRQTDRQSTASLRPFSIYCDEIKPTVHTYYTTCTTAAAGGC